jgi:hypothetical protein
MAPARQRPRRCGGLLFQRVSGRLLAGRLARQRRSALASSSDRLGRLPRSLLAALPVLPIVPDLSAHTADISDRENLPLAWTQEGRRTSPNQEAGPTLSPGEKQARVRSSRQPRPAPPPVPAGYQPVRNSVSTQEDRQAILFSFLERFTGVAFLSIGGEIVLAQTLRAKACRREVFFRLWYPACKCCFPLFGPLW